MPELAESVVLVVGDDEFLRSQTTDRVVARQRKARGNPDIPLEAVDASTSDAVAAFSDATSPALFGGERLVILRSAEQSTKDLVALIGEYAAAPDNEICLVVEHSGGGRAKALATDLQKAGALVERVPTVKSADDRIKYVRSEAVSAGGKIDPKAAAALLDSVGEDLRALSSAARQLVADSGGAITVETVQRYYRGRADVKVYTVADEIVGGRVQTGLEQLRWALHEGIPEVVIADAIAESLRQVAKVAAAGRADPNTLAGRLGMPAWKIRRVRQNAGQWTAPGLSKAMQLAATLNADVKGGAASSQYALERAVVAIAEAKQIP